MLRRGANHATSRQLTGTVNQHLPSPNHLCHALAAAVCDGSCFSLRLFSTFCRVLAKCLGTRRGSQEAKCNVGPKWLGGRSVCRSNCGCIAAARAPFSGRPRGSPFCPSTVCGGRAQSPWTELRQEVWEKESPDRRRNASPEKGPQFSLRGTRLLPPEWVGDFVAVRRTFADCTNGRIGALVGC